MSQTGTDRSLKDLEMKANVAARAHMGKVAVPTIIMGFAIPTVYFSTIILTLMGFVSVIPAFFVLAFLTYACYTIIHESVHGTISGKNEKLHWLSQALGYLNGQIILLSYQVQRREHFSHHQNTNVPGADPDLPMVSNGLGKMIEMVMLAPLQKTNAYFKTYAEIADRKEKIIVVLELLIGIGWRIGFGYFFGWKVGLLLLLGSTYAGGFLLQLLFSWAVHRSFDQTERYKDTSIIIFPKPFDTLVTWIWLYQNYHAIHHLFPRVPFYKYRTIFREIEPTMKANGAPIFRVGEGVIKTALPSLT